VLGLPLPEFDEGELDGGGDQSTVTAKDWRYMKKIFFTVFSGKGKGRGEVTTVWLLSAVAVGRER